MIQLVKLLSCHFFVDNYWNYQQFWAIKGKDDFLFVFYHCFSTVIEPRLTSPGPLFLSSWPLWRHAHAFIRQPPPHPWPLCSARAKGWATTASACINLPNLSLRKNHHGHTYTKPSLHSPVNSVSFLFMYDLWTIDWHILLGCDFFVLYFVIMSYCVYIWLCNCFYKVVCTTISK